MVFCGGTRYVGLGEGAGMSKNFDLDPLEYRQTAGPKRREPILGPAWIWGVLTLLGLFAAKLLFTLMSR